MFRTSFSLIWHPFYVRLSLAFDWYMVVLAISCSLQTMAESTTYPTCPVCLEEFTHDGDKIPKLLPCSHTLCVSCLVKLGRANPWTPSWIKCPECEGFNPQPLVGSANFPTNRHVLNVLDSTKKNIVPSICQVHQKTVMFYLKKECRKTLCPKCATTLNEEHNVASFVEESRTLNGTNQGLMMDTIKSLETYIHQIREAKQIILQKEAEAQKAIEEITRALSGRSRISQTGK